MLSLQAQLVLCFRGYSISIILHCVSLDVINSSLIMSAGLVFVDLLCWYNNWSNLLHVFAKLFDGHCHTWGVSFSLGLFCSHD